MDHGQLLGTALSGDGIFWQPVDDWTSLRGQTIEVHEHGKVMDLGVVDAVTLDGLILWLAFDGSLPRRIIEKDHGRYVRVIAQPSAAVGRWKSP
jgi:hypothetical protein